MSLLTLSFQLRTNDSPSSVLDDLQAAAFDFAREWGADERSASAVEASCTVEEIEPTAQTVNLVRPDPREFSNETMHSVFVTALEGGISYWSECTVYKPGDDGGTGWYAIVTEDGREGRVRIDATTIRNGLRLLLGGTVRVREDIIRAGWRETTTWNEPTGDLDAEGADVVVQLGIYGRIIYG